MIFERKITEAVLCEDGTTEVTYECGHQATWMIPPQVASIACAQCVSEFLARKKEPKP